MLIAGTQQSQPGSPGSLMAAGSSQSIAFFVCQGFFFCCFFQMPDNCITCRIGGQHGSDGAGLAEPKCSLINLRDLGKKTGLSCSILLLW